MKRIITGIVFSTALWSATDRSFTGVITDSMCGANHQMMKITPDSRCVTECVKAGSAVRYVLNGGGTTYKLSDQETPARFAGQKVVVTGTLFPQTGIIRVAKIEAAK